MTQLGSVAATIVLARVLSPTDFGIVAIAQSALAFAGLLSVSGISAALLTRTHALRAAASAYFWAALAFGAVATAILCALAGPIAAALSAPQSTQYILALAPTFLMVTMGVVPMSLLQRRLLFGKINTANVSGSLVYFATEVVLAIEGYGAWAVIVGQIVGSVVTLVNLLIFARFMPRPKFSLQILREDARVSLGSGAGQVASYVVKNCDYWAVSSALGKGPLGVYYLAYVIPNILRLRISAIVRQVALPVYSLADSIEARADAWRRTLGPVLAVSIPGFLILAALAEPIVAVFLGARWVEATDPMRVLVLGSLADLVIVATESAAIAARRMMGYTVVAVTRAVLAATLAFTAARVYHSILAVSIAVALCSIATLLLQEWLIGRPLALGLRTLGPTVLPALGLAACCTSAVVALLALVSSAPEIVRLLLGAGIAVLTYLVVGTLLFRRHLTAVRTDLRRIIRGA